MKKYLKIFKITLSILIVSAIVYFYYRQLYSNWNQIKSIHLSFNPAWLILSVFFMVAFNLLTTYNWQFLINIHKVDKWLNFKISFAIMNISGFTKYLPGKVWAYAIQMYVLKNKGFKPSLVLLDNIVLLIFTLSTPALIGAELYIFSFMPVRIELRIVATLLLLLIYLVCLFFFSNILKFWVNKLNNVFKLDIQYIPFKRKQIVFVQALAALYYLLLILSIACICPGINLNIGVGGALQIGIFAVLSSTIGFITLIVPGGLGVQEAAMYGFIIGKFGTVTALVLPIVIRLVQMFVDLCLGITALTAGKEEIKRYHASKACNPE